jgi:anti-anti-sigma factor
MTPPTHDGFRCDVQPDRDRVIVRPVGELDLATVPLLEGPLRELRGAGFERLVVDLRRVTFLDSSGLRLLLEWATGAANDGYELGIVAGSPPVLRLLELTGAAERLPLVDAGVADAA